MSRQSALDRGSPLGSIPHRNPHPCLQGCAGAARIQEESDLDPAAVRDIVRNMLLNEATRERMAATAAALGKPAADKTMAAHLIESLGAALAQALPVTEFGG